MYLDAEFDVDSKICYQTWSALIIWLIRGHLKPKGVSKEYHGRRGLRNPRSIINTTPIIHHRTKPKKQPNAMQSSNVQKNTFVTKSTSR